MATEGHRKWRLRERRQWNPTLHSYSRQNTHGRQRTEHMVCTTNLSINHRPTNRQWRRDATIIAIPARKEVWIRFMLPWRQQELTALVNWRGTAVSSHPSHLFGSVPYSIDGGARNSNVLISGSIY